MLHQHYQYLQLYIHDDKKGGAIPLTTFNIHNNYFFKFIISYLSDFVLPSQDSHLLYNPPEYLLSQCSQLQ